MKFRSYSLALSGLILAGLFLFPGSSLRGGDCHHQSAPPASIFLPGGDFTGDGGDDLSVFIPRDGAWRIPGFSAIHFGRAGDCPAVGDYDGDGYAEVAVFRPENGLWAARGVTRIYFGRPGDLPVGRDYAGDGILDQAVFRPETGLWVVRGLGYVWFGREGDRPIPADYAGDGSAGIAVFRPSSGLWAIREATRVYFGRPGDLPIPGDYRGEGTASVAIYRESSGLWAIRHFTRVYFGGPGYVPAPLHYAGSPGLKIAVYDPVRGLWAVRGVTRIHSGGAGGVSVPGCYPPADSPEGAKGGGTPEPTATPTPTATPSPSATPVPTAISSPTPVPTPTVPLIDEGFDRFHQGRRPDGWTFINCALDADTYVTSDNSGRNIPALKLDATGDAIVTREFSRPAALIFWLKGQGTDISSALLVDEYHGAAWCRITDIYYLPTSASETDFPPLALNPSTSQVKFTYLKSIGNLAFDDVRITALATPSPVPTSSSVPTPPTPSPEPTATFPPTPIPTATPVPTSTSSPTPIPSPTVPLLDEGFNEYHQGRRPDGWTFVNCDLDADTYITSDNSGRNIPALKLDATGDAIVTREFSRPAALIFWLKGQGTDISSALLVDEYHGAAWCRITDIYYLPTSASETDFPPLALNPSTSQVKFTYLKSIGNLAFDDVRITALATPSPVPTSSVPPTPPIAPTATFSPTPTPSPTPSPSVSPTATSPPPEGYRDIVINEINFAAEAISPPKPELGFEYVELYNRGGIPVTLDGWHLRDEATELYTFLSGAAALEMPPGSYLVIFSGDASDSLSEDLDLSDGSGRLIAGPSWSTYDLVNGGDSVQLFASSIHLDEVTIADFVSYDPDNAEDDPSVDDLAVAAGLWSDGAAIHTASAEYSVGRAIYLIRDGRTDHEALGNDLEDLDWGQYSLAEGGSPGERNLPPTPIPTPTPATTPSPTPLLEPTPIPTPSVPLIDEGFNGFHQGVRPAGWSFPGCDDDLDTYVTEINSGRLIPAIKLDETGDSVVTRSFAEPGRLTFWLKGQGTDATSSLSVEEFSGLSWDQVIVLDNLPTSGGDLGPLDLNRSSSLVRFSYFKSEGNLALDDVRITGYVRTPTPTPEGYHTPTPLPTPSTSPTPLAGNLEIHHIQAYNSDATLIISPIGATLLIDGGGDGQGFARVLPYVTQALRNRQRESLDYIVASNYRPERIGGLDEIIYGLDREPDTADDLRPVRAAYDRGWYSEGREYDDYLAAVGSKRTALQEGTVIDLGHGVTVACVGVNGNGVIEEPFLAHDVSGRHPDRLYAEENFSIALKLTYNDFDYFTAGDLPGVDLPDAPHYLHAIEPSVGQEVGEVEVYRVDHRGSWFSSTQVLVDSLNPAESIVAGGRNADGNPHPGVVERLEAARSGAGRVYRVEPSSAIVIEVGETSYAVNENDLDTTEVNIYFGQSTDHDYALPDGVVAKGEWNIRQSFIGRIRAAAESIDICMSNLGSDWGVLVDELIDAADLRGVNVRVIVDQVQYSNPRVQELVAAGVPVQYDPTGEGHYDMHHKFAVFDYGGASADDDWLWFASLHWFNETPGAGDAVHLEVQDVELAGAFKEEFELMWDSDGEGEEDIGRYHSWKYDYPPSRTKFIVNGRLWEFFPGPNRRDAAGGAVFRSMREMVKHVDMTYPALVSPELEDPYGYGADYPCQANFEFLYQIATFEWCRPIDNPNYFSPGHLYTALERKRMEADILISGAADGCGRNSIGDPLCASCPPASWTESFDPAVYPHQEYGIVDGFHPFSAPSVFFGSCRWTVNSQTWNDESTLLIWDPRIVNQFVQNFVPRMEAGGKVPPDVWPQISGFSTGGTTLYNQVYEYGGMPLITVTGTNFDDSPPGLTVQVGERNCLIESVSPTEVRVRFPGGLSGGSHDLTVTNPNGWNDTEAGGIMVYSLNPTPTPAPTATPSPTPSATPTPAPSSTPSPTPSVTPTASPTPSVTPTATPTPSVTPTATPTPAPTPTSTPSPTPINPPPQIEILVPEDQATIEI